MHLLQLHAHLCLLVTFDAIFGVVSVPACSSGASGLTSSGEGGEVGDAEKVKDWKNVRDMPVDKMCVPDKCWI